MAWEDGEDWLPPAVFVPVSSRAQTSRLSCPSCWRSSVARLASMMRWRWSTFGHWRTIPAAEPGSSLDLPGGDVRGSY